MSREKHLKENNMEETEYLALVEKYPALTWNGFGIQIVPDEHLTDSETYLMRRGQLRQCHAEFEYCCQWITDNPELPGKLSSYNWKHRVENWLRGNKMQPDYIPAGVFTLAAIYMGYRVHRKRNSYHARIGEKIVGSSVQNIWRAGKVFVTEYKKLGGYLVSCQQLMS